MTVNESPDGAVLPDYAGAAISNIFPALFAERRPAAWLPEVLREARQVVVLVLDGLGWLQLQERRRIAPVLASMSGGPATSVVPSTTSSALTSIAVGVPPGEHGVVGYRVHVGAGSVLNILRWRTGDGDALESVVPHEFQPIPPFGGREVAAVTRAEFERGGFTSAFLRGATFTGWRVSSSIVVEVERLLAAGQQYVYVYYDGVDKIAHACGFGAHYDAELAYADRLVGELAAILPTGSALAVTADHGQVEVGDRVIGLDHELGDLVAFASGEARFRWLHAKPGAEAALLDAARAYEARGLAWARSRDEVVAGGWLGPVVADAPLGRLGDVVLAARAPVAFEGLGEPTADLICRHGSLTPDEMLVPLLAVAGGG